ncbi:hypothetical protein GGR58DRAFT_299134 [Xylaria digitata]|nr:hypothetical protein GGR58DRAFT_299134 [Xylaria digitata]
MPNGVMIVPSSAAAKEVYNPDDLTVSIMAFENGAPYNIDPRYVAGTFPDQNTTVANLLRRDDFGLLKLMEDRKNDRSKTGITWLHIPSNNMLWVQDIIAGYYGEERLSRNQMRHGDETSRAARLLREYFWRGQHYGDPDKPSTRFMRPFCQFVTPNPRHKKSETKKIVLFAPFLHWEASRQLTLITSKIEEQQAFNKSLQRQKDRSEREQRKKQREGLTMTERTSWWPRSRFGAIENRLRESKQVEPRGKQFQSKNRLGQYLLSAARLYEEVRNYQDTSLLQKYLFADPPLHPRRTLDQGYYTSPQITRLSGRDQVVSRATTPNKSRSHRVDHQRGPWTCHISSEGCEECLANIRKVSQVVMIDQLWMWILDRKAIITCFPKRYGVHGRDPSGVFEAIQRRLLRARPIHCVMSVAQTILDECSNTFFDTRKDFSGQPQVLDIFSEAIRDVSRTQTLESHHLWNWIDCARRINRQRTPHWNLNMPDWSMSAEGDLEQEIQGIIDELEIMISVNKTQLDVYKDFIQHADRIMGGDHLVWSVDDEVRLGATRLIAKVEERIDYLESLLKTGSNTANMVKDLSQLRQQQDSVVQARQSVKLSLDSIDQGRTIMVFTIVTIIFSPLSFLSSIFGMNNAEFGDNQWKVSDQLKVILSISVGVTALALIFASRRVRTAVISTAAWIRYLFLPLRQAMRYIYWIVKTRRRVLQGSSAVFG